MTKFISALLLLLFMASAVFAEPQDPPDLGDTGYEFPFMTAPTQWSIEERQAFIDIAILALALSLSSWLMLKKRSRKGIFLLSLASLAYFGFWRKGCVCPIGSIQNVAQGFFDPLFILPTVVIAFFFLPIIYTLFFGRSYCASVCPHGAMQDLVCFKPIEVPKWLDHGLGLIGYAYLGFSVLFAATGSAYIICDYDPFIPLFRMSGSMNMLILGGVFLFIGIFIGRPYCRYFCPYGIILRTMGYISFNKVSIFKDRCIECRLCEKSCPFGCIDKSTAPEKDQAHVQGKKQLILVLALIPFIIGLSGLIGWYSAGSLSRVHATVRLADRIQLEQELGAENLAAHEVAEAFWETGRKPEELYTAAAHIQESMTAGSIWLGLFMGLVFSIKLVSLSILRPHKDYEANAGTCFGCARCYEYCPDSLGDPTISAATYAAASNVSGETRV